MKKFLWLSAIVWVFCLSFMIGVEKIADYKWDKEYANEWYLSDKSATIEAKSVHINNFVLLLEEGYKNEDFASHDAIFMETPNNNFQNNLNALKTLSVRLDELKDMDPNNFQYNTAIQQITQQEQGEAQAMMSIFKECWMLDNYPITWGWIEGIIASVLVIYFIGWIIIAVCHWG